MNERIKELIKSMGIIPEDEHYEVAELIVQKCIDIVQPEPYDGDAMTASLNAKVKQIKQHFGVK